jgi:hypothetical protein
MLKDILRDVKFKRINQERAKLENEVLNMMSGKISVDDNKIRLYHSLTKQIKGSRKE